MGMVDLIAEKRGCRIRIRFAGDNKIVAMIIVMMVRSRLMLSPRWVIVGAAQAVPPSLLKAD